LLIVLVMLTESKRLQRLRSAWGRKEMMRGYRSVRSHVRHFKMQARTFLACLPSRSAWPPLGKAGGTIMKRRLIML
jgi:hypothetical protein